MKFPRLTVRGWMAIVATSAFSIAIGFRLSGLGSIAFPDPLVVAFASMIGAVLVLILLVSFIHSRQLPN